MTCAIVATARNEGPFLLEWLAHHLAIGFDKIFVATNDCADGTDDLLRALGGRFPVFHLDNSEPLAGHTFQRSAVKRWLADPRIADQDWVLHCDIDEFLNLKHADRTIHDFVADYDDCDAVMVQWRLFGDGGRTFWDGGSVLDGFITCQEDPDMPGHKVLFRRASFDDVAPHAPKDPTKPLDALRVVTTEKHPLDPDVCIRDRGTTVPIPPEARTWHGACINHYMHKSQDLVSLGRVHRGDANGRPGLEKRTVGQARYQALNRNEAVDFSIQANRAARIGIMNAMMADPVIRSLHSAAQAWFADALLTTLPPAAECAAPAMPDRRATA